MLILLLCVVISLFSSVPLLGIQITKVYNAMTLFNEPNIVNNFRNMDKVGLSYNTALHNNTKHFNNVSQKTLPVNFTHNGNIYNVEQWLENHWTTGLVILKINNITDADIIFEQYYRGNNKHSQVISWSVGKSIVSALVGIAVHEGKIKSIYDNVTDYVPLLKNSGYEGVTIKNILQMSSGIKFSEDYFDFWSEINGMMRHVVMNKDIDDYVKGLYSENSPGKVHNYVSVDTQVLGMVIRAAVNDSLTGYLEKKLWSKSGFECDLFWLIDNNVNKMELAFGTINTCTRDYARFGWLYLNNGRSPLDGTQLINKEWIANSVTPDAKHLMPSKDKLGYGYQWWIPYSENNVLGDYLAIGVYNQFIYVSPKYNIVIAKNSAYLHYENDPINSEMEAVSLFRELAELFN